MSEIVESTPVVSGQVGQPNQPVMGAAEVSSNSQVDVDAIVSKVVERLAPELAKQQQSLKDKRIADLIKGQAELRDLIAGDNPKPAPVLTPQEKAPATAEVVPVQATPVGKQENLDEVETSVMKSLGLSEDDPAVVAAKGLSQTQRLVEYGNIIKRRSEPPTPSAVASLGGKPTKDKEALWAEYAERIQQDPLNAQKIKTEMGL